MKADRIGQGPVRRILRSETNQPLGGEPGNGFAWTVPTTSGCSRDIPRTAGAIVGAPIVGITHIELWSVLRCCLADSTTVIVKSQRDGPSGSRSEIERQHTERVALEFLASIDPSLAPQLLATEFEAHPAVVVLEDLAPREPLREIIVRDGIRPALLRACAPSRHRRTQTLPTESRRLGPYSRTPPPPPPARRRRRPDRCV